MKRAKRVSIDDSLPVSTAAERDATLKVRVQPKASRNQVDGYADGTVRLRVTAPPEGGKANLAVVELLAETLGIPKSRIKVVRGHASRQKLVSVGLLTPADLDKCLGRLGPCPL